MKRFYVYELFDDSGVVLYVGKGSGTRLSMQKRAHALDGREVERFRLERDAYAFERQRIAALKPARNKNPGGNGRMKGKKNRSTEIADAMWASAATGELAELVALAQKHPAVFIGKVLTRI